MCSATLTPRTAEAPKVSLFPVTLILTITTRYRQCGSTCITLWIWCGCMSKWYQLKRNLNSLQVNPARMYTGICGVGGFIFFFFYVVVAVDASPAVTVRRELVRQIRSASNKISIVAESGPSRSDWLDEWVDGWGGASTTTTTIVTFVYSLQLL